MTRPMFLMDVLLQASRDTGHTNYRFCGDPECQKCSPISETQPGLEMVGHWEFGVSSRDEKLFRSWMETCPTDDRSGLVLLSYHFRWEEDGVEEEILDEWVSLYGIKIAMEKIDSTRNLSW